MPRNKGQKILIILILFLAIGGSRPAQAEIDPPFRPASPQILGQGGYPAATASGYDALFVNPSGFASSGGSFTFYGSSFWLYADPLPALRAIVDPDSSALQNFIEDQMTSGGFGFGSSDGIGYVGRGIAAALITIDAYLWGATVGTAAGELTLTLAFISGFAYPFQVKEARVILGMDVRPMIRIRAPIDHLVMQDFLDALRSEGNPLTNLNSTDALRGYALAIDLGALVEGGGLRWGVAIRDFLGTRFNYRMDPFGDILTSLRENGGFPTGGAAVDDHLIPMDVSSGFAYNFDFGDSKVVTDLVLHWGLCDIVTVAAQRPPPPVSCTPGRRSSCSACSSCEADSIRATSPLEWA